MEVAPALRELLRFITFFAMVTTQRIALREKLWTDDINTNFLSTPTSNWQTTLPTNDNQS